MDDTTTRPRPLYLTIADIEAVKYNVPPRPRGHGIDTPAALPAMLRIGGRWHRVYTVGLGTVFVRRPHGMLVIDHRSCAVLDSIVRGGPDSAALTFGWQRRTARRTHRLFGETDAEFSAREATWPPRDPDGSMGPPID